MLRCAISGNEIQNAVVSKETGEVFEKRVIEKYLETNDKWNGEPLSLDGLVEISANKTVKPRPPEATSIPSLLSIFQNEWDAVILESYHLKEQLNTVREELAHTLYMQDAACRVIARLK